jgi:uncharacterized membrane-anchored protein
MQMKYPFVLAFGLLAIVQWVIPGKIIFSKREVLKRGQLYKFQTEPVDPSNPFKGKYITLNFAQSSFTDTVERRLIQEDEVFVHLGTDSAGYAIITNLSAKAPHGNSAYVKANVYYTSREEDSITVFINYPFDEYYMDEFKAPQAESIYRESNRDSSNRTYALVKIWEGQAVIEDVLINDVPIRKLIK